MLCVIASKAQYVPKDAVVVMNLESRYPDGSSRNKIDSLLVRNGFILEPIKIHYSNDETILSTNGEEISSRNISSGERLKWYCFTNYRVMIGMAFDIEKTPYSIEPYEVSPPDKFKKGISFVLEPFLPNDISIIDYSKDKDTIINGQKCFLIKRNKVSQPIYKGQKMEKVVSFQLAINPALKFYAFPFISEKIVQHFGGGAIVYLDGVSERGAKSTIHYSYTDFTPVEKKLFDQYQALYGANLALLDQFKKK